MPIQGIVLDKVPHLWANLWNGVILGTDKHCTFVGSNSETHDCMRKKVVTSASLDGIVRLDE